MFLMRVQLLLRSSRNLSRAKFFALTTALLVTMAPILSCHAFDYEGHRLVNAVAIEILPESFPDFVRTPASRERIAFLGGEPDRWRNTPDLALRHVNSPDHFLDVEDLDPYGLSLTNLSPFRYEFVMQLGRIRAAKPNQFPDVPRTNDLDRTKALVGFLPWRIAEDYSRLRSSFSYWKTYQNGGTSDEIKNAEENIVYAMGVMGHFVADASQPLHTTKHYNGWVGENPHGYTTNRSFHAWIDGGFFRSLGDLTPADVRTRLSTATALNAGDAPNQSAVIFRRSVEFIEQQNRLVELLYRMEKQGHLSGRSSEVREGREFLCRQLAKASQFLAELWITAWQTAPVDQFLQARLAERKQRGSAAEKK